MKKFITLLLTLSIMLSTFMCLAGTFGVSAEESVKTTGDAAKVIREHFSAELKKTYDLADDGTIGIPVQITAFRRSSVPANYSVIFYIVGSQAERIGTDSDIDIIDDFLNEGYTVTVLDYIDNPLAYGVPLAKSAQMIYGTDIYAGKYIASEKMSNEQIFFVPAGCRLARKITFFTIDKMSPYGMTEYIIDTYNKYYAGEYHDNFGNLMPKATSLETCLKKDLTPIDLDMYLDIVYPSNPKDGVTVPVFALASSWENYYAADEGATRPYFAEAVLSGYAGVIYAHEYMPMSRDDHFHYAYNDGTYSLTSYIGVRTATAAIRCIRYYANKYGYNGDYISNFGFSKSCFSAGVLTNPNASEIGELKTLDEWCPEGKSVYETPCEQPFLYYEGTNTPIPSTVCATYAGAGWAVGPYKEFCIKDNNTPVLGSIGTLDDEGGIRWQISTTTEYFNNLKNTENYFLALPGYKHLPAIYYDEDYEADMFYVAWTFLDNHVRAAYRNESPKVLWMTPKEGEIFDTNSIDIQINFSRKMDTESVNSAVKVIRSSDNKEVKGTWVGSHGDVTYNFVTSNLLPGSSYRVIVTTECKAFDGVNFDAPFMKTFSISGDQILTANKNESFDKNGNSNTETLKVSAVDNLDKTLAGFNYPGGYSDVTKAFLYLNTVNSDNVALTVEGMNEGKWNLNKEDASYVGSVGVNNPNGFVSLDVTDYVKSVTSDDVAFRISTNSVPGVTMDYDFDTSPKSFRENTEYKRGGGNVTVKIADGEGIDGSKCVSLSNRAYNTRVKFINACGKRNFTAEDIGNTYKATAYVKAASDTTVHLAMLAEGGMTFFAQKDFPVKANEWNKLDYTIVVTQELVDGNATCLTVGMMNTIPFFIDNVKVESLGGSAQIVSLKDAENDASSVAPTLVLYTPVSSKPVIDGISVIGSGSVSDEILDTNNQSVCGSIHGDVSECKKALVKIPISSITDGTGAEFKFKVNTDTIQNVQVYGLLKDASNFVDNVDSTVTWNSCYGNDKNGYGAKLSEVYGNAPIATVSVRKNGEYSVDVENYVKYLKEQSCEYATFILSVNKAKEIKKVTFENITEYNDYEASWALTSSWARGITKDPENPDNSVFFFDKNAGGSANANGSYYQNVAFTGLLGTDGIWTADDIGKIYNVTFRQYNVVNDPDPTTSTFSVVGNPGSTDYSGTSINANKVVTSEDPSKSTGHGNHWIKVSIDLVITEDIVNNKSTHTGIIVASGNIASKMYIDDIVVTEYVNPAEINTSSTVPYISYSENEVQNKANAELCAVLDGGAKDTSKTSPASISLYAGTLTGGGDGLRKTYYTFDISQCIHIQGGKGIITLKEAKPGSTVKVYGLSKAINGKYTWTNAVANLSSADIDASYTFGNVPLAEIVLDDKTVYEFNIDEFAVANDGKEKLSFVICGKDGEEEIKIDNFAIELLHNKVDTTKTEAKPEITENQVFGQDNTVLSASIKYAVGKEIENVKFAIDGETIKTPLLKCGEVYRFDSNDVSVGKHTFTAEFTVNGETVNIGEIPFEVTEKVKPKVIYGDVNGDTEVDATDLVRLKKYLAGQNVEINAANSDCNGDGGVEVGDLVRLKKYFAGQSVVLGKQ